MSFRLRAPALIALIGLLIFSLPLRAEDAPADDKIYDMGLADLMKVAITSRGEAVAENEAPGVVTVITREQIKASYARNLVDVLQMVPSFQVASDYNGTLGLGVRGNWALEGKVLLMIDGIEMNDLFYNSALLEYAFPVRQISRVEIIRGPGSVIYGSDAEYAVINIITLSAEELNGAMATTNYGRMQEGRERQTASLAYGKKYSDQFEVSGKIFGGNAGISDRDRTYPDNSTFSAKDTSQQVRVANIAARYGGLSARFITDNDQVTARDAFHTALVNSTKVNFTTYAATIEYKWRLSDRLTVTPSYFFKRSLPYRNDDPTLDTIDGGTANAEYNFDYDFSRNKFMLPANYRFNDDVSLLAGAEYDHDHGESSSGFYPQAGNSVFKSPTINYETRSLFSELTWKTPLGIFAGGGRYENHNYYGGYFVPRASWIKQYGDWNFKALYSEAYRNPSVGDANTTNSLALTVKPEKATASEIEASYKFNPHLTTTVNIFSLISRDTLVYDPVTFAYSNVDRTGSRGVELNVKYSFTHGYSQLGASYYDAHGNRVTQYSVPNEPEQLAGFANFKATWDTKFMLSEHLSLQPSLIHTSAHFGYSGDVNQDGRLEVRHIGETTVFNIFANYDDFFIKGLQLGVGVANIFDANEVYATAYDLGRNTLPGPTREWLARLTYTVTTF